MNLHKVKSNGLGNIAIHSDAHPDTAPSSDVTTDGRINVQFHDTPETLAKWCARFQGAFAGRDTKQEESEPAKPRRTSTIAFVPGVEKPTTSPRLNIAIHIVGSRGDVQPFIPIAQLLSKPPYGHRVRICTHPVFKDFVEAQGVEFFSIGGDPEALMAYMVKNPGLLPGRESFKDGDVGKRRKEMAEIIDGAWRSCIEAGDGMGPRVKAARVQNPEDLFLADAIIANPPSMAHLHCAEKLGIPLHMVFTMPWSPTKSFPHPLASMSYGNADARVANYLSFIMMELLTWQGLGDLINKFRTQTLHLDPISPMWGFQLLSRLNVPYSYLWSQSLIPKPPDWGDHINITGFSFLPLASSYTPPPDLTAFLEKGPTPIYIGFGSIVIDDPKALTRLIFKAIKLAGVRVILSKGWGGLGSADDVPEDVYLIGNCPHDWLFERVSAVVHHGGAGTSAAGIAAGRPTVIVPFFGDQPFWGQMVARAGAGPVSVPFKELTAEILAASITFALRPETQEAVKIMAYNIGEEDGALETAQDFQDKLNVDHLRCDICPDRVANWIHIKSGAHLSSFAIGCLIDQELIKPGEMELLRHKHWYVDEGAENPLIGLTATVTGFFAAVGTATSDYSRRLKEQHNPPAILPSQREITPKMPATVNDLNHAGILKDVMDPLVLTPTQMESFSHRMATKSIHNSDLASSIAAPETTLHHKRKESWKVRERGRHGRAYYVTRVTGRYVADVAKAGVKTPVALFYNIANGFHNAPSYGFGGFEIRRRDEITGFGSGVKTAGKEFVLGFYDAFTGVVIRPYQDSKQEGVKGFGKGVWRGGWGVLTNIGAAVFGLSGYTLKGLEKELAKHHLTKLQAEILLIRVRQGINEFRKSTLKEREQVISRWNKLVPGG